VYVSYITVLLHIFWKATYMSIVFRFFGTGKY